MNHRFIEEEKSQKSTKKTKRKQNRGKRKISNLDLYFISGYTDELE